MLNGKRLRAATGAQRGCCAGEGGSLKEAGEDLGHGGQAKQGARERGYFRQEETHGGEKAQDTHGWVSVGAWRRGPSQQHSHYKAVRTLPLHPPLCSLGSNCGAIPKAYPPPPSLWPQGSDNPCQDLSLQHRVASWRNFKLFIRGWQNMPPQEYSRKSPRGQVTPSQPPKTGVTLVPNSTITAPMS